MKAFSILLLSWVFCISLSGAQSNKLSVLEKINSIKTNTSVDSQIVLLHQLREGLYDAKMHDSTALLDYTLAFRYRNKGNSLKAIRFFESAIQTYKNTKTFDYRFANSLLEISQALIKLNRSTEFVKYRKNLKYCPLNGGREVDCYYGFLNGLSHSYSQIGDFWTARTILQSGVDDSFKKYIYPNTLASRYSMQAKALFYEDKRNIDLALNLIKKAEEVCAKNGLEYQKLNIQLDKILFHGELKNYAIMRSEALKSMLVIQESEFDYPDLYLKFVLNYSDACNNLRDYDEPITYLKQIVEDPLFNSENYFYGALQNLAELESKRLNCSISQEYFDRSFKHLNFKIEGPLKVDTLVDEKILLLVDYLKSENCWNFIPDSLYMDNYLLKIDTLLDRAINNVISDASYINKRNDYSKIYKLLIDKSVKFNRIELFWKFSEKSKSLLLINPNTQRMSDLSVTNELVTLKRGVISAIDSLNFLNEALVSTNKRKDEKELDRLEKRLLEIDFELSHSVINSNIELANFRDVKMPKETTLLSFSYGVDSVYLLIKNDFNYSLQNVGSVASIENEVRNILNLLGEKENFDFDFSCFKGIDKGLFKGSTNLMVVTDGKLSALPIEILNLFGSALLLNFSVNYVPSYSFYNKNNSVSKANGLTSSLVLLPQYSSVSNLGHVYSKSIDTNLIFKDLSFSKKEAQILTGYLNATLLKGRQNKGRLREAMNNNKIVHFTGHGYGDKEDYKLSFLALDSTISSAEDVLTSADISQMSLSINLVGLNACNTGVGELIEGEGVFSIGRSFLKAGANSVLQSLWSINDESSAKISVSFYKYLSKGVRKSQALRQAKLEYLNSEIPAFKKHPYYWSGLVLVGDDSPIFTVWYRKWYTMLLGSLFALGIVAMYKSRVV